MIAPVLLFMLKPAGEEEYVPPAVPVLITLCAVDIFEQYDEFE